MTGQSSDNPDDISTVELVHRLRQAALDDRLEPAQKALFQQAANRLSDLCILAASMVPALEPYHNGQSDCPVCPILRDFERLVAEGLELGKKH